MRNERVSICRGNVSVVIDEYSRFAGEREREWEGGRERERTINEHRTLKTRGHKGCTG